MRDPNGSCINIDHIVLTFQERNGDELRIILVREKEMPKRRNVTSQGFESKFCR